MSTCLHPTPKILQDEFSKAAKKKLIDRETTVSQLADELGWSRNYTSQLINGRLVYRNARLRICQHLGLRKALA